jgi:hypothetical protein
VAAVLATRYRERLVRSGGGVEVHGVPTGDYSRHVSAEEEGNDEGGGDLGRVPDHSEREE